MKKQIKTGLIWALLALVLVLAIAATARTGLPEEAAASVDGVIITKEAVDYRIRIGLGISPHMAPAGNAESDELKRQTAMQLVSEELERQEARQRNLVVTPDVIDAKISEIIEDTYLGDAEKMIEDFTAKGVSEQDVREEVYRRLLHQKLLDDLREEVPVTDEELRAEYDANVDSYVYPERRQMRQILVKDEATARSVYRRLQSGEDFATISGQVSIDGNLRKNSGSMGLVARASLPADVAKVAFSLPAGGYSQPFKTADGWSIIAVELVFPASNISFEQKKDELSGLIGNQRMAEHYQKYVVEIYTEYEIRYADGYAPLEEELKNMNVSTG